MMTERHATAGSYNLYVTITKKTINFKDSQNSIQGLIQNFWLGGGTKIIMFECQTCIRYVIVLAILRILIGIGLTNKLQKGVLNCS